MKKVLLIGASGFLGGNLSQALIDKNYDVKSLSFRPQNDIDFCNKLQLKLLEFSPKFVINAAASQISGDDPESLKELNSSNVLLPSYLAWGITNFCPECSLITFGSVWQYKEKSLPYNAYAASKSASEPMLEHFVQDGLKVVFFILSDSYGPNDPRNKIVNLIVKAVQEDKPLKMSGGEQYIDLIHINDIIEAVFAAIAMLSKEKNGVFKRYSLQSSKPVKIIEIINIVSKLLGRNVSYLFNLGYYPYSLRERFFLSSDFPIIDGWTPKKDLEEGLSELLLTDLKTNK